MQGVSNGEMSLMDISTAPFILMRILLQNNLIDQRN